MKVNRLFRISVMSALNEAQKMNQKFPMTAQTFDPFKSDAPDFTLAHEHKKRVEQKDSPPMPRQVAVEPVFPEPLQMKPEHPPATEGAPISRPAEKKQVPPKQAHTRNSLMKDLNGQSLRRAVILSEILAPPLALRGKR